MIPISEGYGKAGIRFKPATGYANIYPGICIPNFCVNAKSATWPPPIDGNGFQKISLHSRTSDRMLARVSTVLVKTLASNEVGHRGARLPAPPDPDTVLRTMMCASPSRWRGIRTPFFFPWALSTTRRLRMRQSPIAPSECAHNRMTPPPPDVRYSLIRTPRKFGSGL